jgi:hypothetical protein
VLRPLRSIFATRQSSFRVPCALDEAVVRLNAATKRSPWRAWLEGPECLIGKVSRDAVVVRWYRGPRVPSEQFRGAFSIAGDTVVLEGQFQHSREERWFLMAALLLLTLFLIASATGLVLVFAGTLPLANRLLTAGFLATLMATTVIAVFFATQPLRQDDINRTSLAIHQALNTDPS